MIYKMWILALIVGAIFLIFVMYMVVKRRLSCCGYKSSCNSGCNSGYSPPSAPLCPTCPTCPTCPNCPDFPGCPTCPNCPTCPPPVTCPDCPVCPPPITCPDCPVCQVCPPPTVCPDCPACPACPDCPVAAPIPPAETTPPVAIDHSVTDVSLNDCGQSFLMPPLEGGLDPVPTSCFVPGKELVVDVSDGPSCITNKKPIALSLLDTNRQQAALINIYPDKLELWTGQNTYAPLVMYPPNLVTTLTNTPALNFSNQSIQVTYKLVSDTQLDVYFSGKLIASFAKPSFPVGYIAFASCEASNNYGIFQSI